MGIIDRAIAGTSSLPEALTIKQTGDLGQLIQTAVTWIGVLSGLVAFFFLVYGGFMYLTAAGNAEQSKKGGQTIINAVIGLIIIALSWVIVNGIITTLNAN